MCKKKKRSFIIILIVSTLFLSFSVFGIASMVVLIVINAIERTFFYKDYLSQKRLVAALFVMALVLPLVLNTVVSASGFNPLQVVYGRLRREVVNELGIIGNDPRYSQLSGSGQQRIINEVNFALLVLRERPLFGYGINYSKTDLNRPMALNAITEVLVRWGIVGFFLLAFLVLIEKKTYKPTYLLSFIVFLLLFTFGEGAIAKPIFWTLLSMIFFLERARIKNKTNNLLS